MAANAASQPALNLTGREASLGLCMLNTACKKHNNNYYEINSQSSSASAVSHAVLRRSRTGRVAAVCAESFSVPPGSSHSVANSAGHSPRHIPSCAAIRVLSAVTGMSQGATGGAETRRRRPAASIGHLAFS